MSTQKNDPVALANLAAQLIHPLLLAHSSDPSPPPMDTIFEEAMERAKLLLLSAVDHPDEEIHIYQLFDEAGPLKTYDQLSEQLNMVSWKGPKSVNQLKSYVEKIRGYASDEVERLRGAVEKSLRSKGTSPEDLEMAETSFRQILTRALFKSGVGPLISDINKVVHRCTRLVVEEVELQQPERDFWGASTFLDYACPRDSDGNRSQNIRPYELFAYAAEKNILSKKLTVQRSDLPKDVNLSAKRDFHYSILVEHRGIDSKRESANDE